MTPTKFKWAQSTNSFSPYQEHEGTVHDFLPVGIYEPVMTMFGIKLVKKFDKFEFTHKVYGVNQGFINRCVTTFKETNSNLGILLNGTKGTGKTVTAKILSNTFELPVIIVSNAFEGEIFKFLADEVRQDVVILFDEFEKCINADDQAKMLTFMDGISSGTNRKVFILTTNQLRVNDNLFSRPSRIRYSKSYGNLEEAILREVAEDMLLPETVQFTESLIEVLKSFSIITMDNVVQFITELNIHKLDPKVLVKDFNITRSAVVTSAVNIKDANAEPFIISQDPNNLEEGDKFGHMGYIYRINDEDKTVVVNIFRDLHWHVNNHREIQDLLEKKYLDSKTKEEREDRYFSLYEDSRWLSQEELEKFLTKVEIEKFMRRTYKIEATYGTNETFTNRMSAYEVAF